MSASTALTNLPAALGIGVSAAAFIGNAHDLSLAATVSATRGSCSLSVMMACVRELTAASANVLRQRADQARSTQSEEEPRESPRAAARTFLELARANRFAEASRLLDLPKLNEGRGAELARRFKAVLDRHLWIDLEKVSATETGDLNDGLAVTLEQLGMRVVESAGTTFAFPTRSVHLAPPKTR